MAVKGENKKIFDGSVLDIRKGEKIALIGSDGAGKSTLMELIEQFHLVELKDRDGRLLSGGQMRRASLAISL